MQVAQQVTNSTTAPTEESASQLLAVSPASGAVPLQVTVNLPTLVWTEGGSYSLDFGDGTIFYSLADYCLTTSTDCTLKHSYLSTGTYTITLYAGKINEGEALATTIISVTDNSSNTNLSSISVPGMSEYTDSDFGFSFWYPSSWSVTPTTVQSANDNGWFQGGAVMKTLSIHGDQNSDGVTIEEFQSSGRSITELGATDSASPVGEDREYYFDPSTHTWMSTDLKDNGGKGGLTYPYTTVADVSNNTMGGLHVLGGAARFGADVIVPLSASDFLVVSTNDGGGYLNERDLANTIVATDPTVATPVGPQEQMQTILKESVLYGVTGTPLPSADLRQWYVDDQYVYDSSGNIVVEANPKTFSATIPFSDGYTGQSEFFGKDDAHVWYEGTLQAVLIAGADPATFQILRESYQESGAGYAAGKSFTYYDTSFEKDASHIWFQDAPVTGADMQTFLITGMNTAKDAYHSYTGNYDQSGKPYVIVGSNS